MTLFILDPNLDRENGHHLEWDLAIAFAARARGEPVVIVAHRDFPAEQAEGIPVRPWFTFTTYAHASLDPVSGRYDDFRTFNETLADDLAALPPDMFRASDALLVPTLNENHLLGYATWMKGFDPARAPLFLLHLMFDAGLGAAAAGGAPVVADPMTALFYQLGFRKAVERGPDIHLFATGQQMSRAFGTLFGQAVPPHPLPIAPRRAAARVAGSRPVCLLFMGDAKPDKGVMLLPALAEAIATAHPGWDVLLHVNETTAWGMARKACADLSALAGRLDNVMLHGGRLSRADYQKLMTSADLMICTHCPTAYARKSSGILWEALALGMPVVVPRDSWLEREATEWNAGAVAAADWSADSLATAFDTAVAQRDFLLQAASGAAERFHAANGADRLMDDIWTLWRPGLTARMASPVPSLGATGDQVSTLAADAGPRGTLQWLGHAAELTFAWPAGEAWTLDIDAGAHVEADQVVVGPGATTGASRVTIGADGGDNRDGQIRLRMTLGRGGMRIGDGKAATSAPQIAAAAPARQPDAEVTPDAPPEEPPPAFSVGRGRDMVRAARVSLDELLEGEVYRHLDLTVHGLAFGEEQWRQVKFKICRDRDARRLEFRRMHGWPDMFVAWPGTAYDQFGEVLHISAEGGTPALPEPRDRALIAALSRCLKEVVLCLRAQNPDRDTELGQWLPDAELHARSLGDGLRAQAATSN